MSIPAIHLAAAAIDEYRRSNPHAAREMRDVATVEKENREIARIVARTIADNVTLGIKIAADQSSDPVRAGLLKAVAESQ